MTGALTNSITKVLRELYDLEISPILSRPDETHGDYTTNIALQVASKVGKPPREIAEVIVAKLSVIDPSLSLDIAGPGFINVRLPDDEIFSSAINATKIDKVLKGETIVAEYSDPNSFKVLHGGHLYTSLVGDAIANIVEVAGASVHRVNFGGDVGLHVAKTMWAIIDELGGEFPDKLDNIAKDQKLDWVSSHYVRGNESYETNESDKKEIDLINARVYRIHTDKDHESPFAQIYWTVRKWSYEGFDSLYERLGMKPFEKYYPESEVSDLGLETVRSNVGKTYEESKGAIIFRGEPYGLFTQVFINSEGLPTYAGKDVGLIQAKYQDFHFDKSFMLTDVAQKDHIAVVLKSIEQFEPELAKKTVHYTHGRIKLQGGKKMSSREGNILKADDILDAAFDATTDQDPAIVIGAVRYSFLKIRIGGDIVYDPKESVSLEGNSGPYLQYALVRARSILRKAEDIKSSGKIQQLDPAERSLARKIGMYPEAFSDALTEYSPHHICTFLYELSQVFNRFYEKSRVIGDPRASERKTLVEAYEKVLSHGLGILGMPKPEKM